jgi:metallo-beta-lactamase family protein
MLDSFDDPWRDFRRQPSSRTQDRRPGDRIRATTTPQQRRERLAAEVRDAASAKGALLPAFAVERTQELLVDLVSLMERGEIPAAPIFLDSPLAVGTTEMFRSMLQVSTATSISAASSTRRTCASPRPSTKARRSQS